MKVSSRDEAIGALRAVTLTVEGLLPQRDISSIWELIDAGEPGIAFENLCTQRLEDNSKKRPSRLRGQLPRIGQVGSRLTASQSGCGSSPWCRRGGWCAASTGR